MINTETDALISIISRASNRYGDKLIDFMQKNEISSLKQATKPQLQKYIKENGLKEVQENERL